MSTFVNAGLLHGNSSDPGSPPRPVRWLSELANNGKGEEPMPVSVPMPVPGSTSAITKGEENDTDGNPGTGDDPANDAIDSNVEVSLLEKVHDEPTKVAGDIDANNEGEKTQQPQLLQHASLPAGTKREADDDSNVILRHFNNEAVPMMPTAELQAQHRVVAFSNPNSENDNNIGNNTSNSNQQNDNTVETRALNSINNSTHHHTHNVADANENEAPIPPPTTTTANGQPHRRRHRLNSALPTTSNVSSHHHHNSRTSNIVASTARRSPGPCSCLTWQRQRLQVSALGITCSLCVLTIRLYLDIAVAGNVSSTYIIHSIIILIDMVLIHLFTFSPWLSAGGEMTTVFCFVGYHVTHETIFEFLETTLIAALCSIHMIRSRGKHMHHEDQLVASLREKEWQLDLSHHQHPHHYNDSYDPVDVMAGDGTGSDGDDENDDSRWTTIDTSKKNNSSLHDVDVEQSNGVGSPYILEQNGATRTTAIQDEENHYNHNLRRDISQYDSYTTNNTSNPKHKNTTCGAVFFEYFLDGSAGVMYTSFLGLILDEMITYGINRANGNTNESGCF